MLFVIGCPDVYYQCSAAPTYPICNIYLNILLCRATSTNSYNGGNPAIYLSYTLPPTMVQVLWIMVEHWVFGSNLLHVKKKEITNIIYCSITKCICKFRRWRINHNWIFFTSIYDSKIWLKKLVCMWRIIGFSESKLNQCFRTLCRWRWIWLWNILMHVLFIVGEKAEWFVRSNSQWSVAFNIQ